MIRATAIAAFIQAGILVSVLLGAMTSPIIPGGQLAVDRENVWSVLGGVAEAVLIVGFAAALLRRHLWGAYGLIADATINSIFKALYFNVSAAVISLVFVAIYCAGANTLRHSQHKRPLMHELRWRSISRYGLLLFGGQFVIAFIFGFLGLRGVMTTMPIYWIVATGWTVLILSLAARSDSQWSFESVLTVCFIAQCAGLVDVLYNVLSGGLILSQALLVWFAQGMFLFAQGIIVWAVISLLPKRAASLTRTVVPDVH